MISSQRIFVLFILIFFSCREPLTAKINSKIPKIVFSEITITQHLINEEDYQSLYFSCLMPKKILIKGFLADTIETVTNNEIKKFLLMYINEHRTNLF